jgi:hypothetical protein
MNLAPLRIQSLQHPREKRTYNVPIFSAIQFSEYLDRHQQSVATRYVLNIGAHDGVSWNDPTYPFFQAGYHGLAIEGGENQDLYKNLPSPDIKKLTRCVLTPLNVADILSQNQVPKNLDFLKLDIDGYDGPLLTEILKAGYRPRLLQIEVNPEIPPPFEFSVMYHPNYRTQDKRGCYTGFYGMSTAYAARIAREFGYHVLCFDFVTEGAHDLILAQNDLADVLGSDKSLDPGAIRQRYLEHPLPAHLHFLEHGINSFTWRYRTDYPALAPEIWHSCVYVGAQKHDNKPSPIYFSTSI